ncbi:hypothetical protein B0H14DRAFT_3882515 [Mycena olivaceomarginata]|nr:hypothetical protein B0H14DRAFT_3882515 [Mycena olivaceomarginata]
MYRVVFGSSSPPHPNAQDYDDVCEWEGLCFLAVAAATRAHRSRATGISSPPYPSPAGHHQEPPPVHVQPSVAIPFIRFVASSTIVARRDIPGSDSGAARTLGLWQCLFKPERRLWTYLRYPASAPAHRRKFTPLCLQIDSECECESCPTAAGAHACPQASCAPRGFGARPAARDHPLHRIDPALSSLGATAELLEGTHTYDLRLLLPLTDGNYGNSRGSAFGLVPRRIPWCDSVASERVGLQPSLRPGGFISSASGTRARVGLAPPAYRSSLFFFCRPPPRAPPLQQSSIPVYKLPVRPANPAPQKLRAGIPRARSRASKLRGDESTIVTYTLNAALSSSSPPRTLSAHTAQQTPCACAQSRRASSEPKFLLASSFAPPSFSPTWRGTKGPGQTVARGFCGRRARVSRADRLPFSHPTGPAPTSFCLQRIPYSVYREGFCGCLGNPDVHARPNTFPVLSYLWFGFDPAEFE